MTRASKFGSGTPTPSKENEKEVPISTSPPFGMASLMRQRVLTCQCQRAFSTSARRLVSLQWDKNNAEALAAVLPPYPYGPTLLYKQSRSGLYGGQRIRFGNNRGEKFNTRTRRTFKPNILVRRLFSKALNRPIQLRVSARVLRTIDKLGGIDEYLLGEKAQRIKELGESGWWLRWAIMQTPAVKKRFAQDRIKLGLPAVSSSAPTFQSSESVQAPSRAIELEVLDRELQAMSFASEAAEEVRDSSIYSAMAESSTSATADLKTVEQIASERLQARAADEHEGAPPPESTHTPPPIPNAAGQISNPYTILSSLDLSPRLHSKNASRRFRLIGNRWHYRTGLLWRPWTPKPFGFRVGRGKHVHLTAHGWRRTRPDRTAHLMQARESRYRNFVQERTDAFITQLNATMAAMPLDERPTKSECLGMIHQARLDITEALAKRLEGDVLEARKKITRRRLAKRTARNALQRAEAVAREAEKSAEEQITIM